jgi:anti-sigma-K factor RskA
MSVHEQFADDLSLYALGALQGEERQTLEKHLDECSACRQEVERLRGDAALLAFSTSGPRPPARSQARLMAAIAKEPRRLQIPQRKRWNWWGSLGWVAAAAALLLVVFLREENTELHGRLGKLESLSSQQSEQLVEAKRLLTTLTSPDAEHFTLVAGKTPPQPQGKVMYVRGNGMVVFLASNMAPAPPQKAYELWLIPMSGAPIPAGLFKPDARGAASVVHPPLPNGVEAKAFAITVEPEAGSPAPTSQPFMMGTGE